MSHLQFELDALNIVPDVAAAAGLSPGDVAHGLLKLWAWCFRSESDAVTAVHLAGFFGGRDAAPALTAFGFLEPLDGAFRVRGAARYLRIKEGRRAGGRKAKGNLKRGGAKPGGVPKTKPGPSRDQAGETLPALPGITPSTEHRAPTTDTPQEDVGGYGHPLQAIWNREKAPEQPAWRETPDKRKSVADARWEERPSGEWVLIVQRLARSSFARGLVPGGDGRTWVATPDFLLKPDTATKVLEGKYDDRTAPRRNGAPVPAEAVDWANAEHGEIAL